jgi:hypothetical protein
MLAAPELESEDHALSYLHRTIENLCIDIFRAESRRPNLVVIDDATAEVEATMASRWRSFGCTYQPPKMPPSSARPLLSSPQQSAQR